MPDGFVFGLLEDVAPVVWGSALAICFKVQRGGSEPGIGVVSFFLRFVRGWIVGGEDGG